MMKRSTPARQKKISFGDRPYPSRPFAFSGRCSLIFNFTSPFFYFRLLNFGSLDTLLPQKEEIGVDVDHQF